MCLGQNLRLAESSQADNSGHSRQQEVISVLSQRVGTYLYVVGGCFGCFGLSCSLYSDLVGDEPGRSGTGDVSTEVETDVPPSKGRAVATRRLFPPAGDGGRPASSSVPGVECIREQLEQAFDTGMTVSKCARF